MRCLSIIFALAAMASSAACAGAVRPGPSPFPDAPVRAVGSVNGDSTGPQVFVGQVPINALVRVHGDFSYTVQPFLPPYVTYDGNFSFIIEPQPGMEHEAIAAVHRGDILIRKNGRPMALHAPGTIRAYQNALRALYAPKPAAPAAAPAPEVVAPPSPVSLRRSSPARTVVVASTTPWSLRCASPRCSPFS